MSTIFNTVLAILFLATAASSNSISRCTPLSYNKNKFFSSILGNDLMKDRSYSQVQVSMDASNSVNSLWVNDVTLSNNDKMAVDIFRLVLWLQNAREVILDNPMHCRSRSPIQLPDGILCDPSHLTAACMDNLESNAFDLLRSLAFQRTTSNDAMIEGMRCHFRQHVRIHLPSQRKIACAIFEDGIRNHIAMFYVGLFLGNA